MVVTFGISAVKMRLAFVLPFLSMTNRGRGQRKPESSRELVGMHVLKIVRQLIGSSVLTLPSGNEVPRPPTSEEGEALSYARAQVCNVSDPSALVRRHRRHPSITVFRLTIGLHLGAANVPLPAATRGDTLRAKSGR
jgi:hypothetical protein